MSRNQMLAFAAAGIATAACAVGIGMGTGGAGAGTLRLTPVTLKKLKFTFETSKVHEGGTDADICVAISYKTPHEAGGSLFLLPTHARDMEKGRTDTYAVTIPQGCKIDEINLQDIAAITIVNGMNRDKPGWHVASLDIKAYASDGRSYMLAGGPVGRWLDAASGEGPALPVSLKVPFQDLGSGDMVGDAKPWKVLKPAREGRPDNDFPG